MLRFSANLSMLFGEYDFLARFEKAAQCGFRGVEFMFPYDYDIEELKHVLASNKLEHTLHNLPAGDWAAGERGIACIPGREEEFRDGVAERFVMPVRWVIKKLTVWSVKRRLVSAVNRFTQRL